jgi:disulfide bond formation protein DsbB
MNPNPFKRAIAMMAAIQAIMSSNPSMHNMLLAAMPQYKSRGHGKGLPGKNYLKSSNKHKPHQGKQECARRVRRMAALA